MNRCTQFYPVNRVESVAFTYCGGELETLSDLRQVLSRQGLHADAAQEQTLLELIQRSHCRRH